MHFLVAGGVRVWHIAAELVKCTAMPPPENPLAVDHQATFALPDEMPQLVHWT